MHLFTVRKAAVTVGVAIAAVGLSVSPAQASTGIHLSGLATSPGQAGYEAAHITTAESVVGTWKVPALVCTSTTQGIAPGSFIFDNSSGSPSAATVIVECSGGTAVYGAFFVINGTGTASTVVVKAGDKLTTSISWTGTAIKATIKDVTTKKSQTMTGVGGTAGAALLGIDTLVGLGVPNFHTIGFGGGMINGKTGKLSGATALDLVITPPTVNIKTGKLDSTGKKFTETFKHS